MKNLIWNNSRYLLKNSVNSFWTSWSISYPTPEKIIHERIQNYTCSIYLFINKLSISYLILYVNKLFIVRMTHHWQQKGKCNWLDFFRNINKTMTFKKWHTFQSNAIWLSANSDVFELNNKMIILYQLLWMLNWCKCSRVKHHKFNVCTTHNTILQNVKHSK